MGIRTVSFVLIAVMLVSCSLAASQARRDVAALAQQIDIRKQRGEFATWTEAVSTLDQEARAVYQRSGVKPDIYAEAQIMVRYYLAEWVDQGRVTEDVGRRELRWADAVIEHYRKQAEQAERDRAALRTLTSLSIINALYGPGSTFRRQPRSPRAITCVTTGSITTCH